MRHKGMQISDRVVMVDEGDNDAYVEVFMSLYVAEATGRCKGGLS